MRSRKGQRLVPPRSCLSVCSSSLLRRTPSPWDQAHPNDSFYRNPPFKDPPPNQTHFGGPRARASPYEFCGAQISWPEACGFRSAPSSSAGRLLHRQRLELGPGDVPPGYSAVLAVPLPVAFPALRAPSGSEVISLVVLVYHLEPCFYFCQKPFTRKASRISPDTRVENPVV